jgi:hypothetical protein
MNELKLSHILIRIVYRFTRSAIENKAFRGFPQLLYVNTVIAPSRSQYYAPSLSSPIIFQTNSAMSDAFHIWNWRCSRSWRCTLQSSGSWPFVSCRWGPTQTILSFQSLVTTQCDERCHSPEGNNLIRSKDKTLWEEPLGRNSSGSDIYNQEYGRRDSPLWSRGTSIRRSWH